MNKEHEVKITEIELSSINKQQPILKKSKRTHVFDLKSLEDSMSKAYCAYIDDDNQETRTNLFIAIKDITYAIIKIAYCRPGVDLDQMSYDYSIYLFERIITGSFVPKYKDRMPWQQYINSNLKHIIIPKKTMCRDLVDTVDDLEFLITSKGVSDYKCSSEIDKSMDFKSYSNDIYNVLRIYYSENDIKRLFPLAVDIIYNNNGNLSSLKLPDDLFDFCLVLLATTKKVISRDSHVNHSSEKLIDKKNLLSTCARSSVFLSSIANSDIFQRELMLALDIDSLYRLVYLCGGKKIKVPSQKELDTFVGAVVMASKSIIESDGEHNTKKLKKDMNLMFSPNINIKSFISKLVGSVEKFGPDESSDPVISIIINAMESINRLFNKTYPNEINNKYKVLLLKSINKFANSIESIRSSLK